MPNDPLQPAAVRPWTVESGGLRLLVRLTPRGGRDAIDGVEALSDGRHVLKARVRAVPEDGAANAALTKLVAGAAGVPASAVEIAAGHTARVKTLVLRGEAAAMAAALEGALAGTRKRKT